MINAIKKINRSRALILLMENYFSVFFTKKCEEIHYTLWERWTAITLASLKIRTSSLHETGGFEG